MALSPVGFTPPIPDVTKTSGVSAESASPMSLLAMLLGQRPGMQQSTGDKMAQVLQLLREIAKEDPRIGFLASEAIKALTEGPPAFAGASGPPRGGGPLMGGPPGVPPMMGTPGPAL